MEKLRSAYADPSADGLPMPRRLGAILAVACGVGLSVLDATIANVALPTISAELGIASADSIWIVNAYQIAVMIAVLPLAALGERIGYRRIYVAGLGLFTLASAGCALAGSLPLLLAARVVQGFGAAAVTSVNTTLIRLIYPRRQLGRGMGVNATVVAISSVAGPSLAAAILSAGSWPWIFAVNIPLGIAALVLSRRFLPLNPAAQQQRRFRWTDAAMNALTFGAMMGLVECLSRDAAPGLTALAVATLAVAGPLYIRSQLRSPAPLLPFDLLRRPIFALSVLTSVCSYLAQMLAMVALPFYFRHTLHYDEVTTGLLLTAWPLAVVVAAPVAGMLVGRIHAGAMGGAGLALMAAGTALAALLPEAPSAAQIVWRMALCGAGFGLFQSPNNSILIASAPPERSGSASGMLATARLLGQTSGAALMALLFHLVPGHAPRAALVLAAVVAAAGSLASISRLGLGLPEGLGGGKRGAAPSKGTPRE